LIRLLLEREKLVNYPTGCEAGYVKLLLPGAVKGPDRSSDWILPVSEDWRAG